MTKKRKPGRPAGKYPTRLLKVAASDDEFDRVLELSTRERVERMLKERRMIEMCIMTSLFDHKDTLLAWRDIGAADVWQPVDKLPQPVQDWLSGTEAPPLEAIVNTGLGKRNDDGDVIVDLDLLAGACSAYCAAKGGGEKDAKDDMG